ncbi:hypothetical protein PRUPE_1G402300 [Prunus persica]|uniref:Uncharacterized protein n=1 Tax=Prunus persica TaxID=3760 RepID=A0A251RBC1_PRUPE|nr:hypothetical protein PRUPE_1G402300 [Prunus persica]
MKIYFESSMLLFILQYFDKGSLVVLSPTEALGGRHCQCCERKTVRQVFDMKLLRPRRIRVRNQVMGRLCVLSAVHLYYI